MLSNTFFNKQQLTEWLASLKAGPEVVYPPVIDDLYSLYIQCREMAVVSILEFGSGFSTSVLALALHQNRNEFGQEFLAQINHPNPFELLTVDASSFYLDIALSRIPEDLQVKVIPHLTDSVTGLFNGQICTYFRALPYFCADFIYLDGPDPDQSKNITVEGLALEAPPLPMSADLLRLENLLWPGTRICVDGRGANSRFLKNNFVREWDYLYSKELDQHFLDLKEPHWGSLNQRHNEFRNSLRSRINLRYGEQGGD